LHSNNVAKNGNISATWRPHLYGINTAGSNQFWL